MYEILAHLGPGARVLDLGCRQGSFPAAWNAGLTVRLDLKPHLPEDGSVFVQADAARLPFAAASIDAIVANHSLEHVVGLAGSLAEIGRVLKPGGSLYVAVPDVRSFTDRLYRKLLHGGGHVNPFVSAGALARQIESYTGLRLSASRTLFTSLVFLNPRNVRPPLPRRVRLAIATAEPGLRLLVRLLRWMDRRFRMRLSVYGWALYFGPLAEPVDSAVWTNVCIRCGAGHASAALEAAGLVRQGWFGAAFRCPGCGAETGFTRDEWFAGN